MWIKKGLLIVLVTGAILLSVGGGSVYARLSEINLIIDDL